ncbi:MAG: TrmH family RNA methyltransferase, partial [Bacteroidota bacterium]
MRKLKNEELDRLTTEDFKAASKNPVVVVLDNVRSMNNVGSAFRSSDAFLIEKICLCGITAQPPHRDINKTAIGATDTVAWEYFETTGQAVARLQSQDYQVVAIEQAE